MEATSGERNVVGELGAEVASLAELFQRTAAEDPDAVALRTPGAGVEISWSEYAERAARIAAALASLGVGRGDTVAIMLLNRPEFNIVDAGALLLGATPFSIYNTLAGEQIAYLLENAGARVVVCENDFLDRIEEARKGSALEHVVCADSPAPEGATALADFEGEGDPDFDVQAAAAAVEPTDLATMIYTSGTTGPPKGVELTHANVLASVDSVGAVTPLARGGRLISYLPSAHAADRFFSHYFAIASGAQITSLAEGRKVAEALPEVRPTSWIAVPRIFEKLKAALEAKFAAEPDEARKAAVSGALDVGLRKARAEQAAVAGEGDGPDDELLAEYAKADELVLGKLRVAIGLDQVNWTMSGAAPIAPETLEFFLALGIPVCELWGMSEMAGGTINPPGRMKMGTVGPPLPGVETRLESDGELLIRSPCVMRGYHGEPEKTAEALDSDGWLHTGDIAEIDDDGYVKIVDRKKELIINAGGKNMSPANIEGAVKGECPLVAQVVAIGDKRPYNVALITLDPDALAGRAHDDPEVRSQVEEGVARGNERLARVEEIKRFEILPEEWQPGGDELTPTSKLKRKPIAEKYADVIEAIYARPS